MTSAPIDLATVSEALRERFGGAVRGLLAGDAEPAPGVFDAPVGDAGLMGPESVAWRVHADIATLIGGLRALLLQTMHPLAMAGVAEHSDYRRDPFGRLQRTAGFVAVTTYGSTEAAQRAIARVRAVHDQVVGIAPDGRPYSANDPELLRWVHATEVDSFLRAFDRYGSSSLTGAETDTYLSEMAQVADALGADGAPASRRELRRYWRLVRPELRAGPQARSTVRFLLFPPVPLWARAPYAALAGAAVDLLPGFARRSLRVTVPPLVGLVGVRPAATSVVRLLGWSLGSSPVVAASHARVLGTEAAISH